MTKDADSTNLKRIDNVRFRLYFEKSFSDSIIVIYDGNLVFRDFVKTINQYEVAKEFCTINKIKPGAEVNLKVGNKNYIFKPISEYQYYYFSKSSKGIGITYSNVMREYY